MHLPHIKEHNDDMLLKRSVRYCNWQNVERSGNDYSGKRLKIRTIPKRPSSKLNVLIIAFKNTKRNTSINVSKTRNLTIKCFMNDFNLFETSWSKVHWSISFKNACSNAKNYYWQRHLQDLENSRYKWFILKF